MTICRLALILVVLAALGAGCGDGESDAHLPEVAATSSSTTALNPGDVPPGTVALFDMASLEARRLDLGRAIIRAEWVDDGETLVAFDANTQAWIALDVDGTLMREIAQQATSSGEDSPLQVVGAVGDGRRVAVAHLDTASFELLDVTTGDTETLFDGERGLGHFSARGDLMAGQITPLDSAGGFDPEASTLGVFAREGDCGDDRLYACLEWEWPQDEITTRFAAQDPWSPNDGHLLLAVQTPCPEDEPGAVPVPCSPERSFEVYSWPERELVLSVPSSSGGSVRWAGAGALFVDGAFDASVGAARYLMTLDGEKLALPEVLQGCCASFSADGRYAVASAIPGEDCSLIEVASGDVVASVPAGAGDTNDTGICQHVSWSPDGSRAIATGVNTP